MTNKSNRKPRGFAVMDKEVQRAIASTGGRASHATGNAHEFSSDEAREAGRRGGLSVSQDREHMREIGRKGGSAKRSEAHSGTDKQDADREGSDDRQAQ
jgi:uncharacterized protein